MKRARTAIGRWKICSFIGDALCLLGGEERKQLSTATSEAEEWDKFSGYFVFSLFIRRNINSPSIKSVDFLAYFLSNCPGSFSFDGFWPSAGGGVFVVRSLLTGPYLPRRFWKKFRDGKVRRSWGRISLGLQSRRRHRPRTPSNGGKGRHTDSAWNTF